MCPSFSFLLLRVLVGGVALLVPSSFPTTVSYVC